MIEETYIETDEQYHSGVCLNEYNTRISLCQANIGQEDKKIYLKWCFPQIKDRKPSEKSLPWKVDLGNLEQAIEILESYLAILKNTGTGTEQTEPENNPSTDDIPF